MIVVEYISKQDPGWLDSLPGLESTKEELMKLPGGK